MNENEYSPVLECRRLTRDLQEPLAMFFSTLKSTGATNTFHPHPLTEESAKFLASYEGRDVYVVLMESQFILGYGMLRGWDEGYSVPTLGIAIHPKFRGRGLSHVLMQFLHATARYRGAQAIKLKVYPNNIPALRLYERFGYVFETNANENQLVGLCTL